MQIAETLDKSLLSFSNCVLGGCFYPQILMRSHFKKKSLILSMGPFVIQIRPCFSLLKRTKLPGFLIIGAQKSATSTLSSYLSKHPYISMARRPGKSEMHFFDIDDNWCRGINWYMDHFNHPKALQGEKTPAYLFLSKCHPRMHRVVPHAKLIIILRNPVDRAYSQWNHYNHIHAEESGHRGWVKTDFIKALDLHPEVVKRGEYIDQIIHLLKFYKREQIYIGITERFRKNPDRELKKIYSFLGIPYKHTKLHDRHVRQYPRPMEEDMRRNLLAHYRPYNGRLFDFLGYSVDEWNS